EGIASQVSPIAVLVPARSDAGGGPCMARQIDVAAAIHCTGAALVITRPTVVGGPQPHDAAVELHEGGTALSPSIAVLVPAGSDGTGGCCLAGQVDVAAAVHRAGMAQIISRPSVVSAPQSLRVDG